LCDTLTLWRLAAFRDFQKKNTQAHVALRGNISAPVQVKDLVEASKDAASLLDWLIRLSL